MLQLSQRRSLQLLLSPLVRLNLVEPLVLPIVLEPQ